MATNNCLITSILQYMSNREKKTHTGLEQYEGD